MKIRNGSLRIKKSYEPYFKARAKQFPFTKMEEIDGELIFYNNDQAVFSLPYGTWEETRGEIR